MQTPAIAPIRCEGVVNVAPLVSLLQTPPSGVWHSQMTYLVYDGGCKSQRL